MKKLIILMMLLLNMMLFAEKLTTDGKLNLDKLKGSWGSETYEILQKDKRYYIGVYNSEEGKMDWYKLLPYQKGAFMIKYENNLFSYFAYDTKYKILVKIDRNFNIEEKIPKKFSNPIN